MSDHEDKSDWSGWPECEHDFIQDFPAAGRVGCWVCGYAAGDGVSVEHARAKHAAKKRNQKPRTK